MYYSLFDSFFIFKKCKNISRAEIHIFKAPLSIIEKRIAHYYSIVIYIKIFRYSQVPKFLLSFSFSFDRQYRENVSRLYIDRLEVTKIKYIFISISRVFALLPVSKTFYFQHFNYIFLCFREALNGISLYGFRWLLDNITRNKLPVELRFFLAFVLHGCIYTS